MHVVGRTPFLSRDEMKKKTTSYKVDISVDEHGVVMEAQCECAVGQVQGQLFCTQRKNCKFVVYTFKGIEIKNIPYNEDFVKKNGRFSRCILRRTF